MLRVCRVGPQGLAHVRSQGAVAAGSEGLRDRPGGCKGPTQSSQQTCRPMGPGRCREAGWSSASGHVGGHVDGAPRARVGCLKNAPGEVPGALLGESRGQTSQMSASLKKPPAGLERTPLSRGGPAPPLTPTITQRSHLHSHPRSHTRSQSHPHSHPQSLHAHTTLAHMLAHTLTITSTLTPTITPRSHHALTHARTRNHTPQGRVPDPGGETVVFPICRPGRVPPWSAGCRLKKPAQFRAHGLSARH